MYTTALLWVEGGARSGAKSYTSTNKLEVNCNNYQVKNWKPLSASFLLGETKAAIKKHY